MSRPRVEILYFDGCPNHEPTRALVERVAHDLQVDPEIELVQVPNADAASKLRFLGSPTVRVNGRDVEPGAAERDDFVYSCPHLSRQARVVQATGRWLDPRGTGGSGVVNGELTALPAASAQLSARTAAVLAAADIPRSKLGTARVSRLSTSERRLYTWIERRFATRGRPSKAETRAEARRFGLDVNDALKTLAREDLVHFGGDGEITVAYPFSGLATAHRVRFPSGHEVYAMCAIDALGIAAMFDETVEITSRDPLSGEEIGARVAPNLEAQWWPASTVVVAGALRGDGDAHSACCPVLNFFASSGNANRWLAEHPEISGETNSIREAILAGRAVFGDVLRTT